MLTFNNCPFSEDGRTADGAYPDVSIFGAPFDQLTTGLSGQHQAPWYIREAGTWNDDETYRQQYPPVLPFSDCEYVDLGDAEQSVGDIPTSRNAIEAMTRRAMLAKKLSVVLGGDDSVNLPVLRAIRNEHAPVDLVVLDAHLDMWPGDDHGTWVRQAIAEDLVGSVAVLGVRAYGPKMSQETGNRIVVSPSLDTMSIGGTIPTTLTRPRYLAIDIDVIDPAYAPGTGFREPFGQTPFAVLRKVNQFLNMPDSRHPRFLSITEVLPQRDTDGITSLLANRLVVEALHAIVNKTPG